MTITSSAPDTDQTYLGRVVNPNFEHKCGRNMIIEITTHPGGGEYWTPCMLEKANKSKIKLGSYTEIVVTYSIKKRRLYDICFRN